MKIPFTKMVGAGNDFIVVDGVHEKFPLLADRWPLIARTLCDRHRGVGADGILLLEPSKVAQVRMRIFNADGSEADMCGNGARCVARFMKEWTVHPQPEVVLETGAGLVSAQVEMSGRVRMQMPNPKDLRLDLDLEAEGRKFRAAFLNTGVPHLVIPVEDLDTIDVVRYGRALRNHVLFQPNGTNVNFTRQDRSNPREVHVRTYERGVEGETLACGTGATASAIVHGLVEPDLKTARIRGSSLRGKEAPDDAVPTMVDVTTRSGDHLLISFSIELSVSEGRVRNVVMEGPAMIVFTGQVDLNGTVKP